MEELSKDNHPSYGSVDVLTEIEKQIIEIGFNLYEKKLKQIDGMKEWYSQDRFNVNSYERDNGY